MRKPTLEAGEDVISWLMQNGWCIEKIKGENEIVRMTSDKHEKPLVIYKQTKESIFASVPDMWYDVISAFYTERKAKEAAGCSAEAKEKLLKLITNARETSGFIREEG